MFLQILWLIWSEKHGSERVQLCRTGCHAKPQLMQNNVYHSFSTVLWKLAFGYIKKALRPRELRIFSLANWHLFPATWKAETSVLYDEILTDNRNMNSSIWYINVRCFTSLIQQFVSSIHRRPYWLQSWIKFRISPKMGVYNMGFVIGSSTANEFQGHRMLLHFGRVWPHVLALENTN